MAIDIPINKTGKSLNTLPFPEKGQLVPEFFDYETMFGICLFHPYHSTAARMVTLKPGKPTPIEVERLTDYVIFRFWRYLGAA